MERSSSEFLQDEDSRLLSLIVHATIIAIRTGTTPNKNGVPAKCFP